MYAPCSFAAAQFGAGTKLIVLDPNRTVTPPTVRVFPPSERECEDRCTTSSETRCEVERKRRRKRKTLVCVASGFYPDTVTLSWLVDGYNVTDGVATDSDALWDGEHFSTSSRLTVLLSDWFSPERRFTCSVSFCRGNRTEERAHTVGEEGPGAAALRERYLRVSHGAQLFYVLLILKSCGFSGFLMVLMLRLQVCSGKHQD
ncbi:hypothetical protein NQZ68_025436 [Dissostichus eleginoides]|nr:hypothetical protein NQZ68_025436 [Dissostichus eleginoides]